MDRTVEIKVALSDVRMGCQACFSVIELPQPLIVEWAAAHRDPYVIAVKVRTNGGPESGWRHIR